MKETSPKEGNVRTGGVTQVVEHVPNKCDTVLSSNPKKGKGSSPEHLPR
jgi:hypothetical protein